MQLLVRKAAENDGMDIYQLLQQLPYNENGFINSAAGKSYEEFQQWLKGVVAESRQTGLVDGWKVPQSVFWFYLDEQPIGFGKIRHFLTESLRVSGGHIGISIHPQFRGQGYGKAFIALLLNECRALGIEEVLCTIQNENLASIRAVLACGGTVQRVSEERHYLTIRCNNRRCE